MPQHGCASRDTAVRRPCWSGAMTAVQAASERVGQWIDHKPLYERLCPDFDPGRTFAHGPVRGSPLIMICSSGPASSSKPNRPTSATARAHSTVAICRSSTSCAHSGTVGGWPDLLVGIRWDLRKSLALKGGFQTASSDVDADGGMAPCDPAIGGGPSARRCAFPASGRRAVRGPARRIDAVWSGNGRAPVDQAGESSTAKEVV